MRSLPFAVGGAEDQLITVFCKKCQILIGFHLVAHLVNNHVLTTTHFLTHNL